VVTIQLPTPQLGIEKMIWNDIAGKTIEYNAEHEVSIQLGISAAMLETINFPI
jgi:hypothetical protein